ncbi:MAG TPA: tripartite tricarboxylate transporter TctB family protein [Methylibium sp.]|uniref:tripartite tricarboxylate transporter TctB family protein n=1 Tax=Methylibium sp. TaxID=2067992 RepID=UPI002DBB4D2D|nr:tripartite tricarboxylate transporter TctB family protein [Methylibium sp.]HEU4458785.1 tripartite tricarboxylate transporter TctB family protein [Methylibium sp.]
MKIKSQRDFVSGLMFVAVGVGFAFGATHYQFGVSARPGPGYFPLLLGVILAILGAAVLFKALTVETDDGEPIGAIEWKPLVTVLAAVAIFGFLLPRVGMLISVPLLVGLSSLAGHEFRWKGVVITAVVLTFFSWLVFVKGLGLVIPVLPAAFVS